MSRILGISGFYHDAAAALVIDGRIAAAAQEERFTRRKADARFPIHAIGYCLEEAQIDVAQLDHVVYYDNVLWHLDRLLTGVLDAAPRGRDVWLHHVPKFVQEKLSLVDVVREELGWQGPVECCAHHLSHAASAYYPSPFDEAAVLTVDGVGEWATASVAFGQGRDLRMLEEMRYPHSLGLLYSAVTYFCGFKVNSGEYKLMGLAPYGVPRFRDAMLSQLVDVSDDGSVRLHLEAFGFQDSTTMAGPRFDEIFGGPRRQPESRITRREMDIAASVQAVTELAVSRMARHARAITGASRLCLAGGVALNCVANGKLLREGIFDDIWIQPAAGDAGGALGAALAYHHLALGASRVTSPGRVSAQGGSLLGPAFTDSEIEAWLRGQGIPFQTLSDEERADAVAAELNAGRVVGHFAGRMEFGPRSLGARSILGDPRRREMQRNLNLKIKYRESFRPFAPAVLAERAREYFELEGPSPHMLLVAPVVEARRLFVRPPNERTDEDLLPWVNEPRSDVPAVTHVDYSARVQTVTADENPGFYGVLESFARRTGCPVLVNTSFNVRGEPIVCTPWDAYRCFMRTEMDVLVLERFLLVKSEQPTWTESDDWQKEFGLD